MHIIEISWTFLLAPVCLVILIFLLSFYLRSSLESELTLQLPETKIAEFANSIDLDEVAHNEPPHLDLHCLPSSL